MQDLFTLNIFEPPKSEDISQLVRKYLPPGTIFEMYQFYVGWCDAHHIERKASQPEHVYFRTFFLGTCCLRNTTNQIVLGDDLGGFNQQLGMELSFGNGMPSGHLL